MSKHYVDYEQMSVMHEYQKYVSGSCSHCVYETVGDYLKNHEVFFFLIYEVVKPSSAIKHKLPFIFRYVNIADSLNS